MVKLTSHQPKPIVRSQRFWDEYYMGVALLTAKLSKDPDRKVGAVLVTADKRCLSIGYNGLPSSIPDTVEALHDKEYKLRHVVHAERNALAQAPFLGTGCTMFVTSFPCCECADLLVRSGVRRVVAPKPDFGHMRWGESWVRALAKMQEDGVVVDTLSVDEVAQ